MQQFVDRITGNKRTKDKGHRLKVSRIVRSKVKSEYVNELLGDV